MQNEDTYQDLLHSLSNKLKSVRTAKGFTQKEVAYGCGMDEQNYRRIENGKTNPNLKSLHRICSVLKITLSDLFKE